MRFFLSSYEFGDDPSLLSSLFTQNKRIGYIPNALDTSYGRSNKTSSRIERELAALKEIGLEPETIDLCEYFEKKDLLHKKISALGGVWVNGGNVFVLRKAMQLSGFDVLLRDLSVDENFVYAGYSAAGCVLSKTLEPYKIVDDPHEAPYKDGTTVWEGIGLINFAFLPHFGSDHPESADIEKELRYCIEQGIPCKTVRDGEVLIF